MKCYDYKLNYGIVNLSGFSPRGYTIRMRSVKIDRAIYLVDDATKTYRYSRPNPFWKKLDLAENDRNKKSIHGYVRVFRNSETKRYFYKKGK